MRTNNSRVYGLGIFGNRVDDASGSTYESTSQELLCRSWIATAVTTHNVLHTRHLEVWGPRCSQTEIGAQTQHLL